MKNWTVLEEMALCDNAHLGAEECTRALNSMFGKNRTVKSVINKASRIGVPLKMYYICEMCDQPTKHVNNSTGFCDMCQAEYLVSQKQEISDALEKQNSVDYKQKLSNIKTDDARLRKKISRMIGEK